MKKIIAIISFVFMTTACNAQWVPLGGLWETAPGGNVNLVWVSDSNLFATPGPIRYDTTNKNAYNYPWPLADTGLTVGSQGITCFASIGSIIFTSGPNMGVYQTTNNGSKWTLPENEFTGISAATLVSCGTKLIGGGGLGDSGYGIYRSLDSDKTWMPVYLKIGNQETTNAQALASGGSFVLAGQPMGAALSTDSGATWNETTLSQESGIAAAVQGNILWIGTQIAHIRKSTDNGQTWSVSWNADSVNSGSMSVTSFAICGSVIFAGTIGEGVLESTDSGASWTAINQGLGSTHINSLTIYDSSLVCAADHGVAYRPLSQLLAPKSAVAEVMPSGLALSVYPNPVTGLATIQYSVPISTPVSIVINDVMGREIISPIEQPMEDIGNHEASFDASALPSGIYWCRMMAGSQSVVTKIVIER